jgi:hypothetical protein
MFRPLQEGMYEDTPVQQMLSQLYFSTVSLFKFNYECSEYNLVNKHVLQLRTFCLPLPIYNCVSFFFFFSKRFSWKLTGIWTLPVLRTRWLKCSIGTLIKWVLTVLYVMPMKCPSPLKPRWFLYVPPGLTLRDFTFSSHRACVYVCVCVCVYIYIYIIFFMYLSTNGGYWLTGLLWLYNGDGVCLLRGTDWIFKRTAP